MKKTTLSLIASLLACSTLFSGTIWADGPGGHHEDRGRGPGPANQRHDNRHDQGGRSPEHRNNRDHFAWNGHDFRRGHVVPHEYRDNIYRVNDWHERGLREPPRGEYWAYIDGNYVLIAAATGIITSLILSNAFH